MDARTGVAIGLVAWFLSAGAIITYNSYKSEKDIYKLKEENKELKAEKDSLLTIIDSLKTEDIFLNPEDLEYYKNINYGNIKYRKE